MEVKSKNRPLPCLVCREVRVPFKLRVCQPCWLKLLEELGRCQECGHNPMGDHPPLCNACYEIPAVRNKYDRKAPGVAQEAPDAFRAAKASMARGGATTAQPGTPEKILVLANRYTLRQALFHPGDPIVVRDPASLPLILRPLAMRLETRMASNKRDD